MAIPRYRSTGGGIAAWLIRIARNAVVDNGKVGSSGWSPIGDVRDGGKVVPFVVSSLARDGSIAMLTDGGIGDPSGTWTVTINSVESPDGGAQPVGPWVMQFDVP